MWLTKKLLGTGGLRLSSGTVAGGSSFAVRGENETQQPETLFPYGFSSMAPRGQKAVLLEGYCAGLSALPDGSLQEGEVRLSSAGGAEILLLASGDVVINGRTFSRGG